LLLPYLDCDDIYRRYRFDEPWDGPNNRKLLSIRVPAYECHAYPYPGTPMTNYVAVVQPGSVWTGSSATRLADVRDNPATTLLLVEIAHSGIHWMEPRDLDGTTMPMTVNPPKGLGISSVHREAGWLQRPFGANVAMVDSSCHCLPPNTPEETIRAMLTIAGGEDVDLMKLSAR
jgi:hypothetical protein